MKCVYVSILIVLFTTSAVWGQVLPGAGSSRADSAGIATLPQSEPFDAMVGISEDESIAAMYRIRKEIAIVHLQTGLVQHLLPLSETQMKAMVVDVRALGGYVNMVENAVVKAFFSTDNNYVWIFTRPGDILHCESVVSEEIFEHADLPRATLEKWDLRTSELVDAFTIGARFVSDVQMVFDRGKECFLFLEKEWVTPHSISSLKSTDYLALYSVANKQLVKRQPIAQIDNGSGFFVCDGQPGICAKTELGGWLSNRQVVSSIDLDSFTLDTLGNRSQVVTGRSGAYRFHVDFHEESDQHEYGALRSSLINLELLRHGSPTTGQSHALRSRYPWANAARSPPASYDTVDGSRANAQWKKEWTNQPAVYAKPSNDGIWIVQNSSSVKADATANTYFHSFDGNLGPERSLPGYVLGDWSKGLVLSSGLYFTAEDAFFYFRQSPQTGRAVNSEKIVFSESDMRIVGVAAQYALALCNDQLHTIDLATRSVSTSYSMSELRQAIHNQTGLDASEVKDISAHFHGDRGEFIVLLSVLPPDRASVRPEVLRQLSEKYQEFYLDLMGDDWQKRYPSEPNFEPVVEYVLDDLYGFSCFVIQFTKTDGWQVLGSFESGVHFLGTPHENGFCLLHVQANPHALKLWFLPAEQMRKSYKSTNWELKTIPALKVTPFENFVTERFAQMVYTKQEADRDSSATWEGLTDELRQRICTSRAGSSLMGNGETTQIFVSDPYLVDPGNTLLISIDSTITSVPVHSLPVWTSSQRRFAVNVTDDYRVGPWAITACSTSQLVGQISEDTSIKTSGTNFSQITAATKHTAFRAALFLDLFDVASTPERIRHMPIGQHLEHGEYPIAIELESSGNHLAITTACADAFRCKIVSIPSNQLLAIGEGRQAHVFTPSGSVILNGKIANLEQLAAQGATAFQNLNFNH